MKKGQLEKRVEPIKDRYLIANWLLLIACVFIIGTFVLDVAESACVRVLVQ